MRNLRSHVPGGPAPILLLGALALIGLLACGRPGGAVTYDATGRPSTSIERASDAPNLVLIVLDTLRADAGEGDPGMPFFRSLAEGGVRFLDATAAAPWTLPSVTSLLTGLPPSAHGAYDAHEKPRLHDGFTTFAEVLTNGFGYQSAAFVDPTWFDEKSPILQGFEIKRSGFALQGIDEMVGPWVRKRDPGRPFFLLLHTFEAHDPYGAQNHPWPFARRRGEANPNPNPDPGPPSTARAEEDWQAARAFLLDRDLRLALMQQRGRGFVIAANRYMIRGYAEAPRPDLAEELRLAYRTGAAWVDGLLRDTVERLRAWGLLENTVLVVLSDHGEAFGEHGILGHGHQLYDELVRVPLVMTGPAPFDQARAVHGGVGLTDVLPTFLDLAGLPPLPGVDGRSALPLVRGAAPGRPVISEEHLGGHGFLTERDGICVAVRSARWKYLLTFDQTTGRVVEEAYDLAADPGETRDVLGPEGRRSSPPPFDDAFCRAVHTARARVEAVRAAAAARHGTIYGVGVASPEPLPPGPCADGGEDES